MRHIAFSAETDVVNRRLPFFLALEEWTARNMPAGDYFFSWQVDPTVICGRNQEIDKEVNLEYCGAHGIDVVRRRSGGGCVFADRQNFMFSFITASDMVTEVFAGYTAMIAGALQKIGIDAVATGRNDKSVPMRVTCLKNEGIALTTSEFGRYMIESLTEGEPYVLTEDDVREVEAIEQGYYDPDFLRIHGREDRCRAAVARREGRAVVPGLGEFCVEYVLDSADGTIRDFSISGDFFMSGDVEERLCRPMEGVRAEKEAVAARIDVIGPGSVIPGLTPAMLLDLVMGAE